MARPPVKVQQNFYSLSQLNVEAKYIHPNYVGMESQRCVSVFKKDANESGFTLIEFENNFNKVQKNNKADSCLPHPVENYIAFRVAVDNTTILQVYNFANGTKMKSVELAETFVYWKWANKDILAIVSDKSVYHLDVHSDATTLTKVFDRGGNLAPGNKVQIINYALDPQRKYSYIAGISQAGGAINGDMQLFLIDAQKFQHIQGHFGCFGKAKVWNETHESVIFACAKRDHGSSNNNIYISEIGDVPAGVQGKFKKIIDFQYPEGSTNDFPIYMSIDDKHGLLFMVSNQGVLFLFEIASGSMILRSRISDVNVVIGAKNSKTGGILILNKKGNVIPIDTDSAYIVEYVKTACGHITNASEVAMNMAVRYGLAGAEQYFQQKFNQFMMAQQYIQAAELVAQSPGELLRNKNTLDQFKTLQSPDGRPMIQHYFYLALEKTTLNALESMELVGLVIGKKKEMVSQWVDQDKLTFTEALGDLIRQHDTDIAIKVYEKAGIPQKANMCKMDKGDFSSQGNVGAPEALNMIRNAVVVNPQQAVSLGIQFTKGGKVTSHQVCEIQSQANRQQELTKYFVECMTDDKPEDSQWQTQVFEQNLKSNPHYAATLFQSGKFTHYNKDRLAGLCEQNGMLQQALECYSDIKDIRRIVLNVQMFQMDYLVGFQGKLPAENCLVCLQDLLRHNRNNLQLVTQVASANFQKLGVAPVVEIFKAVGAFEGIFYFLGQLLPNTQDHEIYFRYIEAAIKCNMIADVIKVIREAPNCYDAEKVKNFLLECKLTDPKPLIYLCDENGYIDELTKYLWNNNFQKYIEVYIFKVNPNAAPEVLGNLIDLEADESYIKQYLNSLRGACPVELTISAFEKRNKIRLMETWLEQRIAEGTQAPAVHNAMAKLAIDTDSNPERFLNENQFYDAKEIGKYCEDRDPHLAFSCYKRDWGKCDYELIELTNKNALYRLQAKYLVERMSEELWGHVLSADNPHRPYIIEQVTTSALPDSKNVDQVSVAVKSFMQAELHESLIQLLEKIVLHNSEFASYKLLQNLLITTAIKTDQGKVMDYVNRLDNYEGTKIAEIAQGHGLSEEAFVVYRKIGENDEAVKTLLYHIESLDRASDFADRVNQPSVWSILGKAYLDKFMVNEAVDCYIKAENPVQFLDIIDAAENEEKWDIQITYLQMARKIMKDQTIDTELLYAYSKINNLVEVDNFLNGPNSADIQSVADKCYNQRLFESAKIFYTKLKSNARIASCLVYLKQYPQALEAAKKANNIRTWKEIAIACQGAGEYKLASVAGTNIVVHPDHLEDLVAYYEKYDVSEEMISLLESCLAMDRSHVGIFTELGMMYAKNKPRKLMDYIRNYFNKLNVSKLLRTCERYLLWNESVYLYSNYEEYDNAIKCMIEHSPVAFKHDIFVANIQKVSNHDLLYKSITFYLEEEPKYLNDLLKCITLKVDLSKVVSMMKSSGYLGLIEEWLKSVQSQNNQAVNDALNSLYLENEDFDALRNSISTYGSIDSISLAKSMQMHDNPQFRRISSLIYRTNKKYNESIELSKRDKQYRDCVETALESKSPETVESLLRFLAEEGEKEFFTVCTYTCYELVRPETVMELAWRHGYSDFAMPFFIQLVRDLTSKVEVVQKKTEDREKKDTEKAEKEAKQTINPIMDDGLAVNNSPYPMLMSGTGMDPMGMPQPGFDPMSTGMGNMGGGMSGMGAMGGGMGMGMPGNMGMGGGGMSGMGGSMGGMGGSMGGRPF